MKELIQQMRSGTLENPRIELLMRELAKRLKNTPVGRGAEDIQK